MPDMDPDFLSGFLLHPDVHVGVLPSSDLNDGQSGSETRVRLSEPRNLVFEFGSDVSRRVFSREDFGHHDGLDMNLMRRQKTKGFVLWNWNFGQQ